MNYSQALGYLLRFADFERTGRFSSRPDILPMRAFLDLMGSPDVGRMAVHIAGSKGKGSTAAMVASILRASGMRVGLYTSPHLHTFRERIRIDGRPISEEQFTGCVEALKPAVEEVRRRYPDRELVTFDLLTAAAFIAFRQAGVDVQVVETGLGGRLDSTNVLREKALCIITPIAVEHSAILGERLDQIAGEKAGIVTAESVVVMSMQPQEAATAIRQVCEKRHVELREVADACRWERTASPVDGQEFTLITTSSGYDLRLPLLGRHQMENAAAAVLGVEALDERGITVSAAAVRKGMETVCWPARIELLRRKPPVVVDGAHSESSARVLRETLVEDLGISRAVLILGVSEDKGLSAIISELAPIADRVVATRSVHPRALPASRIAEAFSARGVPVETADNVADAVDRALAGAAGAPVCVAGSLYVAAEARAHLLAIEGDPPVELSRGRP